MKYTLKEILDLAEKGGFAVPAFILSNFTKKATETFQNSLHNEQWMESE